MGAHPRAASARGLTVRVAGGLVRGVREDGILAWRGIPYAAPPVGALRFRAPQAAVPWSGIRDASRFGKAASQVYRGQFRGVPPGVPSGEDCLTINVLSAATTTQRHDLPVMVFIHGGGYSGGSSRDFSGQGEGFVHSGRVVYVSFNYRLGAFGYLDFSRYSTPDRPFDSNLGLRDQVAALDWVHHNIRSFGGDPDNVTVFGESAGGNAVTTLLATPSARGLFARAIAQSAPSNAVYDREIAGVWAREFIAILRSKLGERAADTSASELLSDSDPADIIDATLVLQIRTPDAYPGTFCLAPVVDGDFLPERPLEAFRQGRAHPVPLIIGTNDREGSIFRGRVDILPRSPLRIRALFDKASPNAQESMSDAYPGLPARRPAADFSGDYGFWYPSVKVAELHSRVSPVHAYRFDFAPRLLRLVGLDATHGVEMFALFDRTNEPLARTMTVLGGRESYANAGERMRNHWLEFACTGTLPPEWPSYTERDRLTFIIDDADRVEADPRVARRLSWENFLPEI
jgi:para-nitrobenzyl esterase